MKHTKTYKWLICFLVSTTIASSQIGIGTNSPKGIVDIDSNNMGFVYPNASLTSTIEAAPVINPKDGTHNLAVGTTIFNTNATSTGLNDVEPGIYSWDGSKWVTHFYKKENIKYIQSATLRTSSNAGYQGVPGLNTAAANTFTPQYSGLHKIEVRGYYGAGRVRNSQGMHPVMGTGNWRLRFNGTSYIVDTKVFSSYHPDVGSGTDYQDNWKETIIIEYVSLVAGVPYAFDLSFDQTTTQSNRAFRGNSNTGGGRGFVGSEVFCNIQFTFLNE